MTDPEPGAIERAILDLVTARGPAGSICPSEAARLLDPGEGWRRLLGPVRLAASRLSRDGRIEILRKGRVIDPDAMRGVIRLRTSRP